MIEFGLTTEETVNKPKFHHQWLPDELYVENDFPANIVERLKQIGYTVKTRGQIGRTEVIMIHPNGKIEAVADKRGDDDARGF